MNWRMYGAGLVGLLLVAGFGATAYVVSGLWPSVAFGLALVGGASIPLGIVYGLRDDTPAGGLVATALFMLAQLTYGRSALVRTDGGDYQWRLLRNDTGEQYAELDTGDRVPVEGGTASFYRFALGDLAVAEQKTRSNMRRLTVDDGGVQDAGTRDTRAGYDIHHPEQRGRDSWLVSLKHVQAMTTGSADPDIVRRGREKALEEAGGTQQIDGMMTMVLVAVVVVAGFILGYGAMML